MTQVTHVSHYDAPPDIVRRLGIDPTLMHRYWPKITKVWDVRGDQGHVGDSFRFREHTLGRDMDGTSEVLAVDDQKYDTLTTYDNGARVHWTMTMTARGDGTDVLNEIDYEVPKGVVYAIADRLMLKRALVDNLRRGDVAFNELARAEAVRQPEPATRP